MECQGGICAISVPENEIEAKKKVPVSSTRTSAELGTTHAIYASSVVASVIPLTHRVPALLDKPGEDEQHLIEDLAFPLCR